MKLKKLHIDKIELSEIIQGCISKDRMSEFRFFKAHYSFAMSVVCRYASSQDQSKEIINESFLKVFKNLKKFDQSKDIKPWLAKIIANTSIDILRKHKRYYKDILEEFDVQEMEIYAENLNNDTSNSKDSTIALLAALPPKYKIVFSLYVFEEYSHKEIAAKLGVSESTSKSNYHRAKNIIRKVLSEKKEEKIIING